MRVLSSPLDLHIVVKVITTIESIVTKFVSALFTQIWFPYAYVAQYDVTFNARGRDS